MFGNGITSGPPEISNASGTQSPRREEEELLGSTSNRFRIDKRDVSGPSKSTIVDDVVNEALHGPRTLKEKVRAISRRFFRLYMSVWNWILFGGKYDMLHGHLFRVHSSFPLPFCCIIGRVGLLFWIFVQSYLVMTRMEAMLQLLIGGNDGTLVEYKAFFGQKMIMYREPSENPWDTYLVLLLYVVTVINRLAGFLFVREVIRPINQRVWK